jgi:hypothetical protein
MRAVAVSVAVAGAVALAVGTTAGTASAATITSGTGTLVVNQSYLLNLVKAGIVAVPTGTQSLAYSGTAQTVTVAYPVTGGTASVVNFAGVVDYSGGLTFINATNGKHVSLGSLAFNLATEAFSGTQAGGSATRVFDAAGQHQAGISGSTQSLTASDLEIDAAGATFLDGALGTTAFQAGDQVGTFATSFVSS